MTFRGVRQEPCQNDALERLQKPLVVPPWGLGLKERPPSMALDWVGWDLARPVGPSWALGHYQPGVDP